jgi:protein phosphatase
MSPCETSEAARGLLEHPDEAFAYFRTRASPRSSARRSTWARARSWSCAATPRPRAALRRRARARRGATRAPAGRSSTTRRWSARCSTACAARWTRPASGTSFATDWVCLDCELMPWSAKAQELLREQYAAVGCGGDGGAAAPSRGLAAGRRRAASTCPRSPSRTRARADDGAALRRRVPALLLAGELGRRSASSRRSTCSRPRARSTSTATTSGTWRTLARSLAADGGVLIATPFTMVVDLTDPGERVAAAVAWWEELTARGGEGMVVKPLDFVARGAEAAWCSRR